MHKNTIKSRGVLLQIRHKMYGWHLSLSFQSGSDNEPTVLDEGSRPTEV